MARTARVKWLQAVALVGAVASLTINFGLIDLVDGFTGYVDQERNQVLDVGWGAVFGLVLPSACSRSCAVPNAESPGFSRRESSPWHSLLRVSWVSVGCTSCSRRESPASLRYCSRCIQRGSAFLARGRQPESTMLALAVVASGPALVYAWRMASAQRRDLPPADAVSNGLHHWTVMTTLALLILLLVLLAALRTSGWRIPAISASIAAGAWAISCLLAPAGAAGSEGHAWAWTVLAWAVVTLASAAWPRARERPLTAEVPIPRA